MKKKRETWLWEEGTTKKQAGATRRTNESKERDFEKKNGGN